MTSASRSTRFVAGTTAVLLLALVMRAVLLHDVPPGLAQDEVLNADVASFIRGGYHALFFREGYGHEPLYHYWQVPFQALLGDNVVSIRLPALFLGMLLVAATMRWARREFGSAAALTAGALLAVSWWPIIFSRVGLRPIMEPLFLVAFAWFWPKRPWLAGLLLGLTFYTYTGARVLFALPGLMVVYGLLLSWRRHAWQTQLLRAGLIVLLVATAVYLPLGLTLRADPTLQQRVEQLQGPLEALRAGDVGPILDTTLRTLGVFSFTGDPRWTYTLPNRPLFDPFTALFFYAGLLLTLLRFWQPRYAFVLAWLLVGLIPSAVTPQAPSTVRLVGAMPVVYLLPGLSLDWLWRRARGAQHRAWATAVPLLAVGLLGLNLALTVRDGFLRWPQALETRLRYQTVFLDMARYREAHSDGALVVADGFYRPIVADSLRRNLNADPGARWVQTGADVAGALVLPVEGNGRFYVPEFAPPADALWDAIGMLPQPDYRSADAPSFAVYALPETVLAADFMPVTLGGAIRLVGYEILPAAAGSPLQMITFWQTAGTLPHDLAAFVHLVDESGEIVSQHDGFDAAPATLHPGDMVIQRHVLFLPPEVAGGENGRYHLQLGLYARSTGERLLRSDGIAPADRILLENIAVIDEN